VLNYSWILDIGCSVLVIEANANIQYRILNNEYPRMKSEGLGFCQGHSFGRIPTGVSKPRNSGAFSLLGAGCLLLDIAANTNNQYRIANAEYLEKRVLNNWWILDIGCSVLVIEANMNSQF
jgi:hypothetical protein